MGSSNWTEIQSGLWGQPELSKKLRMISRKQTKMYEAVDKATEFNLGKKSGDKVAVRLVGRIATLADTALNEYQKLPFGAAPEYTKQITVYRRGFATSWTGSRADLDRADVDNKSIEALRDQAARTLNKVCYDAAVAGRSFCYNALTASTYGFQGTGSPVGLAVSNYNLYHYRKMKLQAKKYNIPPADGQNWFFVGSPQVEDGLFSDTGTNSFVDVSKYDPSRTAGLLAGEIGKLGSVRFVIDNDVIPDNIGTGSVYCSGFLFGQEALKEVMVYPMHLRYNGNLGGEFGNQQAIAWQAMFGIDTIWNYGSHGQANYIHMTST